MNKRVPPIGKADGTTFEILAERVKDVHNATSSVAKGAVNQLISLSNMESLKCLTFGSICLSVKGGYMSENGLVTLIFWRDSVYFYYNSVKIYILQNLGNNMIQTFAQCIETFGSKYLIKKALTEGRLFRIAKGLYSESKDVSETSLISAKYSKAVFTMNSAFYHYGLTDTIPEKYYLATERGAKNSDNRVVLKYENSDILFLGAIQETVNGATVTMYNKERMLLELIRNKSNLPFDYYKEVILNYRKIVDELDMQLVQDYLPQMPKAEMIRKVLEAEVL